MGILSKHRPIGVSAALGGRTTGWASPWISPTRRHTPTADTLASSGFQVLEFTDGINTVTVNALRRFPNNGRWTPYVGGGLGVAVPNVEVQTQAGAPKTFEYQYGGVVAQFQTGVSYELNENWSVFGEYKVNYIDLDVDLDGGGNLSTNLVTNAINIGAGFSF